MNSYIKSGEHAGYTVYPSPKGWVVSFWSRYQGSRNDRKVLVRHVKGIPHDADLGADWNDHMAIGDYLAHLGRENPDKVLLKGYIVS